MAVIQLRVPGRKLHCGFLKALLAGRVVFTNGSMSKAKGFNDMLAAAGLAIYPRSFMLCLHQFQ